MKLPLLLLVMLSACDRDQPAATRDPGPSAPPPPRSAAPVTSSSGAVAEPRGSSAVASPPAPASPPPTEAAWAAAPSLIGPGKEHLSSHGGCEAVKVREWVRILCKEGQGRPWAGDPLRVRVTKGEAWVDATLSHLSPRADGSTSLVYRFVAGTDLEAVFEMSAGRFTLRSVAREPEPEAPPAGGREIGTFYREDSAAVKACRARIPPGHDVETETHLFAQCGFADDERREEAVRCHRSCVREGGNALAWCVKACADGALEAGKADAGKAADGGSVAPAGSAAPAGSVAPALDGGR